MENNLFAGVVIIGIKAPFDLLYYEVNDETRDKVKIGARVMVPYGENNEKRAAVVFKLTNEKPSFSLKILSEIVENTPIDEKLIDFLRFVSDTFLIPLHTLVNEHIEMIENKIRVKFIECTDEKNLAKIASTSNGKKQIICNYILNSSPVRFETLKRKFGASSSTYIEDLEQSGAIKISEKNIQKPNKLFRLLIVDSPTLQEKTLQFERSIRNSMLKEIKNFLETKLAVVDELTLSHNVRNSRQALEKLVEVGILAEIPSFQEKECSNCKPKRGFSIGGSLEERTDRIISLIKDRESTCSTSIIFPEIALIEKVKSKYEETFKETCITWDGKDYTSFISRVSSTKKVILATEGILFHNIANLGMIILEESTSKYYKPNSFSPFDTRLIAMKKAELNNLDILLSASTADESLYYLMKENYFDEVKSFQTTVKVKVIDMRAEFKNKNRNMISYYLKRRINEALQSEKNIALVLNRKPYSTFVMCRECGYVMKCKNCGNTLYFDSERKLLYCPVCGYEEKPPDLCPRCKSPNIYYFGGGIQKLIPEIKSTFRNANILKMVSSKYMKRAIVNSREFTSTIFVGTEFLLSHLNTDNISLFGFISIDTFIENYGHESGVNAFTIVQDAASEIKGKEIIIQTYTPENYIVNAIKNLDFKNFLDQELYLRKSLNYPPFFSLVILSFQNTQNEKVKSTKEYLEKALLNKAQVLGPSNGKEPNTFEITIKVLGATPAQMMEALKSASMKSKVDFNLRVYPTFTYFNSENRA